MSLDQIVNVQITRQTTAVTEAGFGTLMILGTFKNWNDRIRFYTSMQGVSEDFSSDQPEYQAANAAFSQSISPEQIAIGRRQADSATVDVITSMNGKQYTVNVDGTAYTVTATNTNEESTVTMSADFVANNLINVVLNGSTLGTVHSIIDFDINFVSLNSIVATVNGVALTPVVFNTDQATTIAALATALQNTADILTATVSGARQITCVFAAAGDNTVDSVVTTLGATQPVATIVEGGFLYDTSQLQTMTNIQTAMEAAPNIDSVQILPDGVNANRKLVVTADPNFPGVVDSFTVYKGVSQATATIVNADQAVTSEFIAAILTDEINATATDVTATDNLDGTLTIDADVADTPYTLSVSSNIINPNSALISILDAAPNTLYEIELNGVDIQYTSPNSATTSESIATEMTALINAVSTDTGVDAVDNSDGTITIAAIDNDGTIVCEVTPFIMGYEFGLLIEPLVASESVDDSLDAIVAVDDTWYALACTDRTIAICQSIAAWVESKVKLFGTASADLNIINKPPGTASGQDNTSIAYKLFAAGYARSFVLYNEDANHEYPECAWFGSCLPLTPGSETWAFKKLNGVVYSDLSANQENNTFNKNCNTYEYIGGVGITQKGTVAVGEYIDVIRGVDWLTSTIQTYVYSVLVNMPKVPYTDAGITSIEGQIKKALSQGITNNFLANDPPPTVTVPKAANISSADKSARILRNVNFQATLAGAIQAVRIQGTVSV